FKGAITSIAQAATLTAKISGVSLMLDVYHSWWDVDLLRPPVDVAGIQICGLRQRSRDEKPDRVLLDDSMVQVEPILRRALAAAPGAFIEFELFDRHRAGREVKDIVSATIRSWTRMASELA